jgi:PAS domain S-box-containing protein
MVGLLLRNHFPMLLWWGPRFVQFYNDAYRPIPGDKHPRSLGQAASECWAEIWHIIGPMVESAFHGEAACSDDLELFIRRRGFLEETHFKVAYSPVPDQTVEPTRIGGVLATVAETTEQVFGERQLRVLRELGARAPSAQTPEAACEAAAATLGTSRDVSFALFYLLDEAGTTARLAGSCGFPADHACAPGTIDLASDRSPWPVASVARSRHPEVVTDLGPFGSLPTGPSGAAPRAAVVLPLAAPDQAHAHGVIVAGADPHRFLDEGYRTFFELAAAQVMTAIRNACAFQEERKRAEALAEIDRAKTAFFSNVSHEFRTPLTLMLSPLEAALSERTPLGLEDAALIHRNGQRLLKLVNTLLDFARIEAGRAQASYEPIDLPVITADLASSFRSLVEKAGLRLVVTTPRLSTPVHVDREMWEKIVLNLLSNAFKFTFRGSIEVALAEAPETVELSVADSGIGIPEDELPRLFERFHRVEGAQGRTHEGTGIGLALVHELVKLHGGSVRVESRLGAGTRFVVAIPKGSAHLPKERLAAGRTASTALRADAFLEEAERWLPEDPAAGPRSTEHRTGELVVARPSSSELRRPRILLADDNADMRAYVSRLLSDEYEVVAVSDGEAALAECASASPDLVLTDVMMPRLDGFGLLARLRADARTRTVPVLLLSARAGEDARIDGLAAGADDYLTKPFSARELLARVAAQVALARVRRASEQAIARQTERFEALLEHAPLGVYLVDGDFRIRHVNPTARSVFGDIPDLVGRDFGEVIHRLWPREYADETVRLFRRTLDTGEPHYVPEMVETRRDHGAREYYEWRIDRIPLSEGHGVVCYFRDISQQVHAREALEATDRRKDEFLAMLAHELRNPLAPIMTAVHLLAKKADPSETLARSLAVITRQTEHLSKLVDDLLEVSRITQGKIRLAKEPLDVATVVSRAVEISRPLLNARKHELAVAVPRGALWIEADMTRIAQVLGNLLNNAAKYTREGGRIVLAAERQGETAVFSVRDNGIGIAPELLPRVFDLFTQADTSLDRSEGGLGIGLTLARGLVQLHGGTIEARSAGVGRGSEFVVRLPLGQAPAATIHETAGEPLASVRRRILVVDDNRDAAESLMDFLADVGHSVFAAYDGPSGLEAAQAQNPDVVLLDLGLPKLDGYSVARELRRAHGSAMMLIALTGYGQEEDRRRTREAGFDHHFVKPICLDKLCELLASEASASRID